nr:immunoglobulin heavy chain junction region [Mus musculus]
CARSGSNYYYAMDYW